jgi:hypothetical protein
MLKAEKILDMEEAIRTGRCLRIYADGEGLYVRACACVEDFSLEARLMAMYLSGEMPLMTKQKAEGIALFVEANP